MAGPMARDARDLRLLFSVLAGYDPQDPFSAPVSPPAGESGFVGIWEQFYDVPVDPGDPRRRSPRRRLLGAREFIPQGTGARSERLGRSLLDLALAGRS